MFTSVSKMSFMPGIQRSQKVIVLNGYVLFDPKLISLK
jgi:hypothetical protein